MMIQLKGFKVSDVKRSRIVGVACKSLCQLVTKGKTKLSISSKSNVRVFLPDGTEVESEEYFQSLPNQTTVLLKQDHEDLLTGADLVYHTLKNVNIDIIRAGEKVTEFFDENIKEKVRILAEVLNARGDIKTGVSERTDDPDWFAGLETNAKTKEAFMFRRSQERIRGYFYKSRSDIKKTPVCMEIKEMRQVLDDVFSSFSTSLNKDKYFGCFFDRTAHGSLCDSRGYFKCSGVWKRKKCLYNGGKSHEINPYSSREERIVFSTWNLDHCVERSRSIVPSLLAAARTVVASGPDAAVNASYFYSLLFTSRNLRLVHIVCHDKGAHAEAHCDPTQIVLYSPSRKKQLKTIETCQSLDVGASCLVE